MQTWTQIAQSSFWGHIAAAKRLLLMLDYDGTLAPFVEDRFAAVPYPGVRELLTRLAASPACRLVMVTGRPIQELIPLLALPHPVEVWGEHGTERLTVDGAHTSLTPPTEALLGLEQGEVIARNFVSVDRLERKSHSVAVHVRGMDSLEASQLICDIDDAWEALAEKNNLEIASFNGGYELRIPGFTKAFAVETLLKELPEDYPSAYLGDDDTDEDAFTALGSKGLSVLVSKDSRPSAAQWQLAPPNEVLAFLERVTSCLGC